MYVKKPCVACGKVMKFYHAVENPVCWQCTGGDRTLSIWTIYYNPSDFPGQHVARRFIVDKPTDEFIQGVSLEELREHFLGLGLTCLPRNPQDDPVVVECWL